MTNKALYLQWQWKVVLLNYLIHVPTTRFFLNYQLLAFSIIIFDISQTNKINQNQGPFDTFLVGGDMSEVCDIKFSNDGKSMLLTTTNNNIYVLDAYGGEKVSCLDNIVLDFINASLLRHSNL